MSNRIVFILPYFGRFNNYFQLFLNSCAKNPSFDWLIFTDDRREFKYPKNVKVTYMSFADFSKKIQARLSPKICLDSPHKLCDFKPTYGYIFEEYVVDYEYWGYCDCDLIFGNLEKFINDETLAKCDKFGVLGHLSLIKNTPECNRMFMKKINYIDILSKSKTYTFDEVFNGSINSIFRDNGKKIVAFSDFADIHTKSSIFKLTHFIGETLSDFEVEGKKKSIFVWNDGVLERLLDNGVELHKEEYAYIHLQKRKMNVKISENSSLFKIVPNAFEHIEKDYDGLRNLNGITTRHLNLHYFKLRSKNLKNKILRRDY